MYDTAFAGLEDTSEACRRIFATGGHPDMVVLRFWDPVGRRDRAGRVIPHDFVVFGPLSDDIDSVEAGRQRIWPLVAEDFAEVWEQTQPPPVNG
ncbi:hypothetical protein [Modestobacter italicus]|uniref:hypothetical protein n=1 Tax=Modestobacter italicus (strain DSM 44449 / CECT 9708 / BC 501) TaxID=2732864 RepID=UPI001E28D196|nr:hypothetical protein [Modestobacter marinus]